MKVFEFLNDVKKAYGFPTAFLLVFSFLCSAAIIVTALVAAYCFFAL